MNPQTFIPHREDPPPRKCGKPGCKVLLSSANTTTRCWLHGGWLEVATYRETRDSLSDLIEEIGLSVN